MDGRRGSEELAAYYHGLLVEQEESGLSVAEFAEDAGVSAATLYSWRRRLRDEEEARVVEVDVIDELASVAPGGGLCLYVDGRYRVEFDPDFDPGALSRLLEVLDRC